MDLVRPRCSLKLLSHRSGAGMAGKHNVNSSAQPRSKARVRHLGACLNISCCFLLFILHLLQPVQAGADLALRCCAFLLVPNCQGLAGLASLLQLLLGVLQQRHGCQSACQPQAWVSQLDLWCWLAHEWLTATTVTLAVSTSEHRQQVQSQLEAQTLVAMQT